MDVGAAPFQSGSDFGSANAPNILWLLGAELLIAYDRIENTDKRIAINGLKTTKKELPFIVAGTRKAVK
ncbi:hypothetical protein [Terribacillus sp. 7520-G]|uniref:hypothetical protein n=1 Tax=Terribacillus TaxID=459532 RepID=UPI000BA5A075|nr:hypothetical protein [Terribacillus sp. 7520-G]PAD37656.1 hypothetical protein CHH53_15260 [Terribacillus sp. 7520-G]